MTVNDTTKPLLLIDVDGVLNPARSNNSLRKTGSSKSNTPPEQRFHLYKLLGFKVWLNRWHGEQLLKLADQFELTWCTTWQHDANSLIGPRLGLPELPVIEFDKSWTLPSRPDGTYFKTHDVVKYAAGRPFAWIDDEIAEDDGEYITKHHPGPARLLSIHPAVGLVQADFDELAAWATELQTSAQPARETARVLVPRETPSTKERTDG